MTFSFKTLLLGRRLGHGQHNSLFGYLVDGLSAVGSLLIFSIMAMIVVDVLSRNLFNQPIAGVAEMVAASIVIIVFLQLPSTLRHGRMAQADIFIQGFTERRPRLGHGLQSLFFFAGAYMLMVVYQGTLPTFLRAWERHQFMGVEGVFTFPVWPIRLVVIACALITVVQYLLYGGRSLVWAIKGGSPEDGEETP
ncbi:TRAP transporter small permease subunit [Billgrantia endophytica]|uniref:TRAP transporter small permease protein n=1 Tax=Billgrantia endophytica TaxID=2033802 RepID=A0A2N7TXI8_9GAMM|nr:TRAP transporter small permease [Halomonas endophytica]PMR72891.1 TRAP transporter small permease [Halomonas endophytica]